MKITTLLFSMILVMEVWLPLPVSAQGAKTADFSLFFTNDVRGETEPCG